MSIVVHPGSKPIFVYTRHVEDTLADRGITRDEVERTILDPEERGIAPRHPERLRAVRKRPDRGERFLRVASGEDATWLTASSPSSSAAVGGAAVRARYDPDADALDLRLTDAPVTESEGVRPGIVLDFDADGRVVAIEILDATEHLSAGTDLSRLMAA